MLKKNEYPVYLNCYWLVGDYKVMTDTRRVYFLKKHIENLTVLPEEHKAPDAIKLLQEDKTEGSVLSAKKIVAEMKKDAARRIIFRNKSFSLTFVGQALQVLGGEDANVKFSKFGHLWIENSYGICLIAGINGYEEENEEDFIIMGLEDN